MGLTRIVFFTFLSLTLSACTTPHIPDPDYAGMFADRFAAEFEAPETARAAWLEYGASAVRKVQDSVYPPVSYEDFGNRAIARIRGARAAYPEASPALLSFVALDAFFDPVWLTEPNEHAAFRLVNLDTRIEVRTEWVAPLFDQDKQLNQDAEKRNPSYSPPAETGLGIAVLKVPAMNETLEPYNMDRVLFKKLRVHDGAILLDLRGNGGGLVTSIPRLAEFFLPSWTLLFTNATQDEAIPYRTKRAPRRQKRSKRIGPVLILIDEHTNAGAITIAAAMLDHGVGHIAGAAPEHVKNTVDDIWFLETCPPDAEGCAVRVPSGQIIRPSGANLGEGLKVDYPIDPQDREALIKTVKIWLGEMETAAAR